MSDDPILSTSELASLNPVVLLDARPGVRGAQAYAAGHLEGAMHVDLERDLAGSADDPRRGGRHPLPAVQAFCDTLGRLGITPESQVVLYDDQGGAQAASRAWWMLRALGHSRARVLDGGLQAAEQAGWSLSQVAPQPSPAAPYPAQSYSSRSQADATEVERARNDRARCVLDVRSEARYAGKEEPLDPVAGHIPGAVNLPFANNLRPDGHFKSAQALRALYSQVLGARNPADCIVHCGSGVTACHSLLAMERAGLKGAALYVGSWSEWCLHPFAREPAAPRAE